MNLDYYRNLSENQKDYFNIVFRDELILGKNFEYFDSDEFIEYIDKNKPEVIDDKINDPDEILFEEEYRKRMIMVLPSWYFNDTNCRWYCHYSSQPDFDTFITHYSISSEEEELRLVAFMYEEISYDCYRDDEELAKIKTLFNRYTNFMLLKREDIIKFGVRMVSTESNLSYKIFDTYDEANDYQKSLEILM